MRISQPKSSSFWQMQAAVCGLALLCKKLYRPMMQMLLLDLNGQMVKLVTVELNRNSGVGWKQFKHDHPLAVPPY